MGGAYHVCFVRPSGYVHAEGLREVAETVEHGLLRLGVPTTGAVNELIHDGTNIVIGAHLLAANDLELLPADTILYNFEQLGAGQGASDGYAAALGSHTTWDYSRRNLAWLERQAPGGARRLVPVGYVPQLTRIQPAPKQDIDVLFYGSVNERRQRVLQDLVDAGVRLEAVFGVYGGARDALIARSKLVLNLHYHPTNIFEVVRTSYLLANGKAVVAECGPGTEIDADLFDAVRAVPYERLVPACLELLEDEAGRAGLEERALACMQARDEAAILARAIGARAA